MIDLQRLLKLVLFALVIPVAVGGIADYLLGSAPLLLIVVSVICIPLTTVWIIRVILSEMDRVVETIEAEIAQAADVPE